MNFFKRIFNKKENLGQLDNNLDNLSIDKDGNITSVFTTTINNEIVDIPISTTIKSLEKFEKNQDNPNSCEREPKEGEIKLSVNYPLYKLKGRKEILEKMFNEQELAALRGYHFFIVSKKQFEQLQEETKKHDEYNDILTQTANLNNQGITFEKENKIDEAICIYEKNITLGYPATHAYERLMILYRKRKETENEINVIKRAIQVFEFENNKRANELLKEKPYLKDDVEKAIKDNKPLVDKKTGKLCFNPYQILKYKARLDTITNKTKLQK